MPKRQIHPSTMWKILLFGEIIHLLNFLMFLMRPSMVFSPPILSKINHSFKLILFLKLKKEEAKSWRYQKERVLFLQLMQLRTIWRSGLEEQRKENGQHLEYGIRLKKLLGNNDREVVWNTWGLLLCFSSSLQGLWLWSCWEPSNKRFR